MCIDKKLVQRMKDQYPAGTRIELDYMGDDPRPIEPGTKGTVRVVDDIGTVHCDFDNGRCLGLVPGVDSFHAIAEKSHTDKGEIIMDNTKKFAREMDRPKFASEMSVHELCMELRSRANVVAVQVWQEEDICNAFETQFCMSEPTQKMVDEVSARASDQLEDCSHGWDILYGIVDAVFSELEDEFEDETEKDN